MATLQLFAYYYPWYDGLSNQRRFSQYRDFPPALGFYRSDDVRVIDQHLRWAVDYGLDGFLVEWTGVGTTEGLLIDNSLNLMRERMKAHPAFRYAVFYDQQIRFTFLDYGDPEKRKAFIADLEKIAAENFNHPNYWFIGDRPVLVIYLTRSAGNGFDSLLLEARERMTRASGHVPYIIGDEVWWSRRMDNLEILDGVTAYNLHNNDVLRRVGGTVRPFMDDAAQLYEDMQRQAQRAGKGLIPGIGHAYNDEGGRGNLPILPTWQEGSLPHYREDMAYTLHRATDVFGRRNPLIDFHGLAPVFVTSFNEWPERSSIEPSAEIETFNEFYDFPRQRVIRLPGHGFQYLEGIRDTRPALEAKLAVL